MTHPTKSIYKLILQDYVKVSSISVEETLYDEKDLLNSMDKITPIDYHQVSILRILLTPLKYVSTVTFRWFTTKVSNFGASTQATFWALLCS